MRHVLIFIFATLVGSLLLAQPPGRPGGASPLIKGTIKGILIDSLSKAPLEYASVVLTLPGGKMLDGVVTEPDGSFRIRDVNTSTYALQCTFLGYEPKTIRELTTTPEHPDLDLGYVFLVPMGINLEEIVVAEEAPIMESKIDKIVYNADKDITNTGGDGADVLRKVPLLSVDLDGNVSLRGNSNVRIFINGKPSSMFAGSIADALKSLPADQIKSVEVITTPTAKYDGEGSTGIINILMKKSELEGLTGSADVSVGTRSNNAGLNLAHTRGRFGINMNAGTRFTWKRPGTNSFYREDDLPGGMVRILSQEGKNNSSWRGFNGSLGAFYDFNAFHSLTSNVRINGRQYVRDGITENYFNDPEAMILQNYSRFNDDVNLHSGFDWSTDYRRTFAGNKEREWTMAYQLSGDFSDDGTRIEQTGEPTLLIDQDNGNQGLNLEHILQTDYVHPFSNVFKLESGLKATLRRLTSDYAYRNYNEVTGQYEEDPLTSGAFNYLQDVAAAYISTTISIGEFYALIVGARYEQTWIEGDAVNGELPFTNTYGNLLPSAIIQRKFGPFSSLKMAYSQRIQRPGLSYINPYQQLSDPRNITVGNPTLLPELTNQIELSYNAFVKGTVYNASLYYQNTADVIENFLTVNAEGASVTTYRNIGEKEAIGLNLFTTAGFFKKKLTVRISLDVNTYSAKGTINGATLTNEDLVWRSFVNLNYDFGGGYKAEMFGMFRSQNVSLQGRTPNFWMYSFAFQKEFGKSWQLGITIVEPFNLNKSFRSDLEGPTFRQESDFTVPFQSFGVSARYRFGKIEGRSRERNTRIKSDDLKGGDDQQF